MGRSFLRPRRLLTVTSALIAAVAISACTLPTATSVRGGGSFVGAQGGQGMMSLSYRALDASTGAGLMSGTYSDSTGGSTTTAGFGRALSFNFNGAQSDLCALETGMSCAATLQSYCADAGPFQSVCEAYLSNPYCAGTLFNYVPTRPIGGVSSGGQGVLMVCATQDALSSLIDSPVGLATGGAASGPGAQPVFTISIGSGPYSGYSNEGTLNGSLTFGTSHSLTTSSSSGPVLLVHPPVLTSSVR